MRQEKLIAGANILLVEDNDDDAEIIHSIFKKNQINNVVRVRNGEDAVDYLFDKKGDVKINSPRVVFLDINLPKMNGLDVLKKMRCHPKTSRLPVFVFTSSDSNYNVFESYKLGITSYIQKKTSFEKFEEAVMETELYLQQYKVLILEDNYVDAEILKNELERSYLDCVCHVAKNKNEYVSALYSFKPDIIFADYDLAPNFDAIQAIHLLKKTNLNIPFILITGKLSEEFASSCLSEGMDDFLLKGQLGRFPLSLITNLKKKKNELSKTDAISKLQKSEKELKTLFEAIDEVFFSVDMVNNKIIQISPACKKIFGFSRQEFMDDAELWKKCMHPDDAYMLIDEFKTLFKGQTAVVENRIIHSDGTIHWLQRKVTPTLDENGKLVRVDGVASDITERKEAESKRQKYEKDLNDYKFALDQTSIVSITDSNGIIKYVNENFCKISQYTAAELIGHDHRIINSGYHPKTFFKNLWDTIKEGKIWRGEVRNRSKDGRFHWVDATVVPFLDENGKPYQYLVIRNDITERKKAEKELQKKSTRLMLATEAAKIGIWERDLETNKVFYDERMCEISGIDKKNFAGSRIEFIKLVHQDDVVKFEKTIQDAIDNTRDFEHEFRIIWPDKTVHYLRSCGTIVRDKEDKPVKMVGVNWDITKEKLSEEQIRQSEEKYRMLFRNNPMPMWVLDLETINFLAVNEAALIHYGYTEQQFLNLKATDIRPAEEVKKFMKEVPSKSSKIYNAGIWKHKKANGQLIDVEIFAYPTVYEGREAELILVNDITENLKAQKKLYDSEVKYRSMVERNPAGIYQTTLDGKFIAINHAFISILGYHSVNDLISKNVEEIYFSVTCRADYISKLKRDGHINNFEIVLKHSDGRPIYVIANSSIIKDANSGEEIIEGTFIDITEKKKAEKKIEEVLKRYELIAQATNDTIWDWDIVKDSIIYNHGITAKFGYQVNEVGLTAQWWEQNIHFEDKPNIAVILKEAFQEKKQFVVLEYRYRCADSTYKNILDRMYILYDHEGKPERAVGMMQDVTEQKDEEMRINKAILETQEKERQQIGMELHDNVNQILGASLLYLGMAKEKERSSQFISKTVDSCILYIKDAITEIRKLSHQLAPASINKISLKEIMESLVNSVNADNKFRIQMDFDDIDSNNILEELRLTIYRILQEQLNNIIKYSSATNIKLRLMMRSNAIHLKIRDDGKGFDPKKAKSGIGIENMKRRVKMFNGEFKLSSSPGNGCEVLVKLPIKNN